ncbi:hypothetical protein [Donghicola sp. XS_ASV15]
MIHAAEDASWTPPETSSCCSFVVIHCS